MKKERAGIIHFLTQEEGGRQHPPISTKVAPKASICSALARISVPCTRLWAKKESGVTLSIPITFGVSKERSSPRQFIDFISFEFWCFSL